MKWKRTSKIEQVKLIAKCVKEIFHKDAEPMSILIPIPMKIPFIIKWIKSAVRKLKKNKIPGKDKITAKLIKSTPDIAYQQITKMYIAETGEYRNEIAHSTQKPCCI